jgi:predicted dehydrogenase
MLKFKILKQNTQKRKVFFMSNEKKTVRFAVIGCGLMGKEFACAVARWCQLSADMPKPVIVGVCDLSEDARRYFTDNFDTVKYSTNDYHELLAADDIDAVYCAVPHNLHKKFYIDIINAGKHLLAEKPFGIDMADNDAILEAIKNHPEVTVRCSSEFPFFPGAQEMIRWIQSGASGKIIEIRSNFHHSSDMDVTKPINWKRMINVNGEYGCMGDLGLHAEHIPFRMGWIPESVSAYLSDIVKERPDGKGGVVPCLTWDNAHLVCNVKQGEDEFPMIIEMKRICPGATNSWNIEIDGLNQSARFSTDDPNAFYYTEPRGREQAWCRVDIGSKPMIPTITGSIFEFGFSDSILQMWATFVCEVAGISVPFGCLRPEETALSHKLQTAALISHKERRAVSLSEV